MENKSELAGEYFKAGYNCAQSVLAPFGPDNGVSKPNCMMMASAFGGGYAGSGHICGAITGALMVIGLHLGDELDKKPAYRSVAVEISKEFISKFKDKYGCEDCKDLLGIDVSTPEGHNLLKADPKYRVKCTGIVEEAVKLLEKVLENK